MRGIAGLFFVTVIVACGGVELAKRPSSDVLVKEQEQNLREDEDSEISPQTLDGLYDPGKIGPYQVAEFSPPSRDQAYKSAMIYYPRNILEPNLPATTLTGGFTNTKEQISWMAKHLASHGMVVIAFTPSNEYSSNAKVWAEGHKAAIKTLQSENLRFGSPIAGRIDSQRLGVTGYSLGGSGSILAANELPNTVRVAIPICAYQPVLPTSRIPYMFVTGTTDTVSWPIQVYGAFFWLKSSSPKAFVKLNNLGHFDILNGGFHHESIARFVTAWSQVFLADKKEYDTYLNGDLLRRQLGNKKVFAASTDYIYQAN